MQRLCCGTSGPVSEYRGSGSHSEREEDENLEVLGRSSLIRLKLAIKYELKKVNTKKTKQKSHNLLSNPC